MGKIWIAGCGLLPEHLSAETKMLLKDCDSILLQTEKSYLPAYLDAEGLPWQSADDCYEAAEDFDDLQRKIAERIIELGQRETLVYAVPGSPLGLPFLPILREKAQGLELTLSLLPAPGFGDIAQAQAFQKIGWEDSAATIFAGDSAKKIRSARQAFCIEELDTVLLAAELKLHLTSLYPDDWPIWIAQWQDGQYAYIKMPLYEIDRQQDALYASSTCLLLPELPFEAMNHYQSRELSEIIARLRAPGGCPWDQAQTHDSAKRAMIEEAYEALEAIELQDDEKMIEELGDLLMQVYFHAEIGREEGRFDMDEITTGICQKLIYRHPHVFADLTLKDEAAVLKKWDELKRAEKGQESYAAAMRDVPKTLPALMRAEKIQKRAANGGLKLCEEDRPGLIQKIQEKLEALSHKSANDDQERKKSAGELLFLLVFLLRLDKIDAEETLESEIAYFVDDYAMAEEAFSAKEKDISAANTREIVEILAQNKNKPLTNRK